MSKTASVKGYKIEVNTIYVGEVLNCLTVWIEPEEAHSPERYPMIRFRPDECKNLIIKAGLAESYPTFPEDKRRGAWLLCVAG